MSIKAMEFKANIKKINRKKLISELFSAAKATDSRYFDKSQIPDISILIKYKDYIFRISREIKEILNTHNGAFYIGVKDLVFYGGRAFDYCDCFLGVNALYYFELESILCDALYSLSEMIGMNGSKYLNILECAFLSMPLTLICTKFSDQIYHLENNIDFNCDLKSHL